MQHHAHMQQHDAAALARGVAEANAEAVYRFYEPIVLHACAHGDRVFAELFASSDDVARDARLVRAEDQYSASGASREDWPKEAWITAFSLHMGRLLGRYCSGLVRCACCRAKHPREKLNEAALCESCEQDVGVAFRAARGAS